MPETQAAEAANRLYWESDESVADIAARFDFSRRALYDAVRPLPAGVDCEACGGELAFENRLARKSGSARCPVCGATREAVDPPPSPDRGPAGDMARGQSATGDRDDARTGDLRQRAVLLSGAAIVGVAIGGVATWLAKRRD